MKVLYVDDDRLNALLFSEACRLVGGVEVRTADCGAEAVETVDGWRPDLAVIDLHLPDTRGTTLLPQLRARLGAPRLRAYLCSADDLADVAAAAREAGFDGCWVKPLDLAAITRELLQPTPPSEGADPT
ncbi:MAG: response regulator [Burkholderiales bacterium]|nr:response regulator [Burkholderiales bacterium]